MSVQATRRLVSASVGGLLCSRPACNLITSRSCCDAGFGGNLDPSAVFPTSVAALHCDNLKTNSAGRASPGASYPVKNGVVVDWSDFEELASQCFYECVYRMECQIAVTHKGVYMHPVISRTAPRTAIQTTPLLFYSHIHSSRANLSAQAPGGGQQGAPSTDDRASIEST